MIQTEKISHDERARMAIDETYLTQLAKALRYWKSSRALAPMVVWLGFSSILLALLILVFANMWVLLIIPGGLIVAAMIIHGQRKNVSDDVVWSVVREHYQKHGFNIDCQSLDATNELSLDELSNLINKSLDRHQLRDEGLRFATNNVGGHIYHYIAEKRHVNEKGNVSYSTVFDGIVISLDPMSLSMEYDIQISPISKMGRLVQDTLSTISNTFSDVRFSNEELNDRLVLKTEGYWNGTKNNEWLGQRFSTNLEEVFYQLYQHYGVFWTRMYRGKIWLAFPEVSGLIFSGEGRLNRYMLPNSSITTENFEPRKWSELFYIIGVMEALVFNVQHMLSNDDVSEMKLASDFDTLIKNKTDVEKETYSAYHQFQTDTHVAKILNDEQVIRYKKEYLEG